MFENWESTKFIFFYSTNGTIEFEDPGSKYKRPNDKRNINAPVGQKYCKFKTEITMPKKPGVYALFLNNSSSPIYIGKTINLHKRWSFTNYCNISPKNVFYNGQSTNCKINHFILEKVLNNNDFTLKFLLTNNYNELEIELIKKFNPMLNVQRKR